MSLKNQIVRITDILRRDDGISGAMHYTEQISWVLFLKFLDDYELDKESEAELEGYEYEPILSDKFKWNAWACPKTEEGKLNHKQALTGSDLREFVNEQLFPYLKEFKDTNNDPSSVKYKIGEIFEFLDNRIASGHTLREVLDIIDSLNFQSKDELFELGQIYEDLLVSMGSDGGNSGEFHTPRPLIRAMVEVLDPKPGQTIYDGACGSCGFFVEAFAYLTRDKSKLSANDWANLQANTFFGVEKTPLAYVLGVMNMILHGVEAPNIIKSNTLTQNIRDIQEKDRYDIILANPPFGGKEKAQIQQNFPIKSNSTELLFMQHFLKVLKTEGQAAIVVPEGVLFQTNKAFQSVKRELLDNYSLHTILSLPSGVFLPYSGVKTNVIFFERKGRTSEIWYYDLKPKEKLTKNKPLTYEHLKEFVELYPKRTETENSWTVNYQDIDDSCDISAKNPNDIENIEHLSPIEIIKNIESNDKEINALIKEIKELIQ